MKGEKYANENSGKEADAELAAEQEICCILKNIECLITDIKYLGDLNSSLISSRCAKLFLETSNMENSKKKVLTEESGLAIKPFSHNERSSKKLLPHSSK